MRSGKGIKKGKAKRILRASKLRASIALVRKRSKSPVRKKLARKKKAPNPFERARKRMQFLRAMAELKRNVKSVSLVQERARFVREARESPQKVCEFLEGMQVPRIEALEDCAREKGKKGDK